MDEIQNGFQQHILKNTECEIINKDMNSNSNITNVGVQN